MNATFTRAWSPLALFGEWPWTALDPASAWHAPPFPALNVWTDEDALHVEAEVPGLGLQDLDVSVLGDELIISGERADVVDDTVTQHRRERGVGKFSRTLRLPVAVEAGRVEARLQGGLLSITLPKAEALRPRKIEVKNAR
jgi:HSP20 family protein